MRRGAGTDTRQGIRLGLHHVAGLGEAELESIARARAERPFVSLEDFVRRTGVPRPAVENLIRVGAFDSLAPHGRRALLWRIEEIWRAGGPNPGKGSEASGEAALPLRARTEGVPLVGLREFTAAEKVRTELEVLGLDVTEHLLTFYSRECEMLGVVPAAELSGHEDGERLTVAGVKVATQTPAVRSGKRIIFLTLDDPSGPSDVTLFPDAQAGRRRTGPVVGDPPDSRNFATIAFHSFVLAVRGKLRRTGPTGRGLSIVAEELWDLQRLALGREEATVVTLDDHLEARTAARARARSHHPSVRGRADLPLPDPVERPRRVWHSSGGSAG